MQALTTLLGSRNKHLPPGPRGRPIIGNLRDIPRTDQWKYFLEQSHICNSDVNMYTVLGKHIIILNSRQSIDALFEKKVEDYSSKPPRKMSEISDLTMTLPFMNPGDVFSNARKQFHLGIGPSAVNQYDRDYEQASRKFMQMLSTDLECKQLDKTIDSSLGHVFLKVSTGYNGENTESILEQMNNLAHFAADVLGDKYQIFDILPPLAWLPTWVPTIGPQLKLGERWKKQLHNTAKTTVNIMHESSSEGKISVMSSTYTAQATEDKDDRSTMIAVTMNAGGMLATESATLTFLLAMAKFPEIQKRAQAEVDAVVGGHAQRLPTMADRPNLPYVDAILSEVLRWVSIAPVIGREVNQDDHYKEYLIPKGATIMANNYAISRDEAIYPEPESFRPERFLDAAGTKLRPDLGSLSAPSELESQEGGILHPMRYAFGFGHRTCPGRFLADALLFSHFAHILATYEVALPPAEERRQLLADEQMHVKSNGAACRLEEVYVRLAPRSAEATALVNKHASSADGSQANGHATDGGANGVAH